MYKYFKIYKPYGYLSQFTQEVKGQKTLKDLAPGLSNDIYPIGRLDKDSEGLLLLTNHRSLTEKILNPQYAHRKYYWVQVEGEIPPNALRALIQPMEIRIKKKTVIVKAEKARKIPSPPLEERDPPIRERKNIPTSWIEVVLTEGKNRQIRKMCAKTGFPALRLCRYRIEDLKIDNMKAGDLLELKREEFIRKLSLDLNTP